MSGPWDNYAPAASGPWSNYAPPAATLWDQIKSIPGGMVSGLSAAGASLGQGAQGEMGQIPDAPDQGAMAAQIEKNVTGPLPNTGAYGRAIGEALGNPASYLGPGGLGVKAAGAIASGIGGQFGSDVAGMPGALIGGLAGAGGAARAIEGAAPAAARAAVPTAQELKAAAQAGYKAPEVAAVSIKPAAVTNLAASIENDLLQRGFRPTAKSAGDTFGEIRDLRVPANVQSVQVADIDTARQALGNLSKEVDAIGQPTAEAAAARMAISKIDDFLPNLSQADLLAGDAAKANSILQEARANYKAYKQSSLVDTKQANAQLQADTTRGGTISYTTPQTFKPLLRNNEAGLSGFSGQAAAAANQVVKPGLLGDVTREVGRFAPVGPVNLALHGNAAVMSGGATLPFAAAALIARKAAEASTRANVANLKDVIARQSPLYAQRAAALPAAPAQPGQMSPALLRALLLSTSQIPFRQ